MSKFVRKTEEDLTDSRPRHEEGTCGAGDTNIANKLEPRVDSKKGRKGSNIQRLLLTTGDLLRCP